MRRLIYTSHEVRRFNVEDLVALLARVRSVNAVRGITGVLFYHDGAFLQFLEGEEAALEETMVRIRADRRHRGILVLCDQHVTLPRLLPEWNMAFYHLTAIEPLVSSVSPGLIENADGELERRLRSPAAQDVAGHLLAAFWQASRSRIHRDARASQAG